MLFPRCFVWLGQKVWNARHKIQLFIMVISLSDPNVARENSPDSIRAIFGTDALFNAIHCSASVPDARREINFFFPGKVVDPLPSADEARAYLAAHVNDLLTDGLTALCKTKPEKPLLWLSAWLLEHNPHSGRVEQQIIEPSR